jgi:hypothetical protein
MPCLCFQVGGPFISEDPDCPIHGHSAEAKEYQEFQQSKKLVEILPCNYAAVVADMLDYLDAELTQLSNDDRFSDRVESVQGRLIRALVNEHLQKLARLVTEHSDGKIS